jgi:DNA-binding response OmpR family regulator
VKVLIFEDDPALLELLSRVIVEEGGSVQTCTLGSEGYGLALSADHDVIILDRMLPDREGLSVCEDLRRAGCSTPILVLTARGEVQDRVQGLKSGADDYLIKPFEVEELLARLEALTRRARPSLQVTIGELAIDRLARRASAAGQHLDVTAKEFELLEQLAIHPDEPVSRADLLTSVWNLKFDPGSGLLDVHVSRLRDKLGAHAWMVETVRGVGYRLRSRR